MKIHDLVESATRFARSAIGESPIQLMVSVSPLLPPLSVEEASCQELERLLQNAVESVKESEKAEKAEIFFVVSGTPESEKRWRIQITVRWTGLAGNTAYLRVLADLAGPEPSLPGVDFEAGVENFGDPETFKNMLLAFAQSTQEILDTMASSADRRYITAVHGLKGSARAVMALGIADRAEELERAAKAENWSAVQEKTPALVADTEAMLASIRKYFGVENDAESTEGENFEILPEIRKKILDGCKEFDEAAILKATRQFPDGLKRKIEKLLRDCDYDSIQELLP
jgi:HPt (histidine-containing phosphotransfer) domain-containing protein